MISSLANFLMLILYRGYGQSVAWTLLMYTMGAVCVARIAIEQDRTYSIGYAVALALAAFVVMVRFVPGSFIFCAGILALIAYLSDRIVHDCTLIDDSVDASGQGLIEFGKGELKRQLAKPDSNAEVPEDNDKARVKKGHQPGRTVMYLALGALPLFGIGQFLLRSDAGTWGTAQKYLAIYLFSSLSLLVTTSFLGLRRYLRQRKVDMPGDVTVAWLAGGLVMIGAILSVAYLAPMPGQLLASIEMPEFLTAPKDLKSSSMGWGDEAAEKSSPDSSSTAKDKNQQGKEIQSIKPQEGAPAGDSGDGKGDKGPTGKQSGAKKPSSGDKQSSPDKTESGKQDSNQPPSGKSPSGERKSQSKQSGEKKPGEKENGQSKQSSPPDQSSKKGDQSQQSKSADKKSPGDQEAAKKSPSEKSDGVGSEKQSEQQKKESQPDKKSNDDQRDQSSANNGSSANQDSNDQAKQDQPQQKGKSASQNSPPESSNPSPSASSSVGNLFSMIGGLLKLLIMAGLFVVVAVFVYRYRDALADWWASLWNRDIPTPASEVEESLQQVVEQSPRPFATFRNPIGDEKDPRRIVVITFQAFEAWTREQGWKRDKNETPSEFIRRVAGSIPNAATPAAQIVEAYNRIVYGRGKATQQDMSAAKQVWQAMKA